LVSWFVLYTYFEAPLKLSSDSEDDKEEEEEEEEESEEESEEVSESSSLVPLESESVPQNLLDYARGNQREFVSNARQNPSVASDLSRERSFAGSKAAA
jgi:hypothetical protein|tara:strand:+ start:5601 stop:5897 length:297 start_codon:yes stop_codon:yes gene_type:complete